MDQVKNVLTKQIRALSPSAETDMTRTGWLKQPSGMCCSEVSISRGYMYSFRPNQ